MVILYDRDGNEKSRYMMEKGENEIAYIRKGIGHTNIPISECVFLEVTPGPFNREKDNIFYEKYPDSVCTDEVKSLFSIT